MARKKKTLTLTEEHILLISNIKFEKFVMDDKEHFSLLKGMVNDLKLLEDDKFKEYNDSVLNEIHSFNPTSRFGWGCDQWSLFGGTYVLEDIALILGCFDQAIENSENLATGRRYPKELEEKMFSLYEYICENMTDILDLTFTFISKGGIEPGTYECVNYNWTKKEIKK
jgi:hypothetical protein